ncbi:MAG: ssDNA-binding protein [Candidatus Hydrothermia bacterium]
MTQSTDPTVVLLRSVRLSYPRLLVPRAFGGGEGEPKYSASLLIPKTNKEALAAINGAWKAAVDRALPKFGGKTPPGLTKPWVDGDAKDPETGDYIKGEECRGCYVLSASSKTKPSVLTRTREPAVEEDDWAGEEAHVLVKLAGYVYGAKKGVTAYLNGVLLTGRGDRIDGRVNVTEVFAGLEDEFAANDETFYDDALLGNAA